MSCMEICFFGLILFFSCVNGKECEPLDVKVYVDDAVTLDSQKEQVYQLINCVASAIPRGSVLDLNLIGIERENIASVPLPSNNTWQDRLKGKLSNLRPEENKIISFETINQDLLSYYGFKKYMSKAELVIIFVVSSTKLEGRHSLISRKKAVVVSLGNAASPDQKRVASREDHVFVVPEAEVVLDNITERLVKTICKDSKLYCDTDHYSLKRGSECKKCSKNVCTNDPTTTNISDTCLVRCPYYNKPTGELKKEPETNYESWTKTDDQKFSAIAAIVTSIGIVVLVVVLFGTACCILYRRRNHERHGNGEDVPLHGGVAERQEEGGNGGIVIPISTAYQETLEASGIHGQADEELAAALVKNENEREMNETALEPPVLDIHGNGDLYPQ